MAVVELFSKDNAADEQEVLEMFLPEIKDDIDDAIEAFNERREDVETWLRYFNGEVDLASSEGRSKVVSTQVRDAIRNLKPSILRVLCSTSSLVKYQPTNIHVAPVVEQQQAYVHQFFWKNGGYELLRDAVDESLKVGKCAVKTYWAPNVAPTYAELTMMTLEEVAQLDEMPDVEILNVTPNDHSPDGGVELYDVELEQTHANGKVMMYPVPLDEFFISRNARSTDDARVHGNKRSVTVSEAIELGLEHDDWFSLDDEPENSQNLRSARDGSSQGRDTEEERGDVLSHRFLLTEAYVRIDLHDAGYDQLYCVYLGGTDYELLGWNRETESPFDITIPDPKAFTTDGTAIPEITQQTQDVMTSLLRGTVDNQHAANRPRLAGDPQKVNFDDLMHHEIDYPIRMKQGAQVQVITVPSTLQGSLPLLQWMEEDTQNKLGITKAAQGLDPDALQSTDKDAVRNTIALSQGQVELMVRNIVHSLIIPLFRKLLRLSIQHMDRYQVIRMQGEFTPVDQLLFDPTMYAEPDKGLGTADEQKRAEGLQFTLQQQLMLIEKMGMDNPFVSASNVYNTLEDLTKMFGIHNVSRYFNMVTPDLEKQYVEQKKQEAAEAAQAQQPMDPGLAMVESEKVKSGVEKLKILSSARNEARKLQYDAIKFNAEDDRHRDEMAQQLELKRSELLGKFAVDADTNEIKREQARERNAPLPVGQGAGNSGGQGGGQPQPRTPNPASPRPNTPQRPRNSPFGGNEGGAR